LRNKDLSDLYASPDIRVVKSWRMRWSGHVAHVVEHIQNLVRETWRKKRTWKT